MDILEELKIKTHNCTVPGWATRAAQEIERLRGGEVVGYAMVRDGKVCGLESTEAQTRSWVDAVAIPVVMVMPNDRVEGRAAALSRRVTSHDGLCRATHKARHTTKE